MANNGQLVRMIYGKPMMIKVVKPDMITMVLQWPLASQYTHMWRREGQLSDYRNHQLHVIIHSEMLIMMCNICIVDIPHRTGA